MDFSRKFASLVTSYLMTNEYIVRIENSLDAGTVLTALRIVELVAPNLLHEVAPGLAEFMHAAEESMITDLVLDQFEEMAEPARTAAEEQETPEQGVLEQEILEQEIRDADALEITAEAELEAAVLDEPVENREQAIPEESEKSQQRIEALKKEFEQERQELTAKLDDLADKYLEKYPDLSDDQRLDAMNTFDGVKTEAMEGLQAQQDARMAEEIERPPEIDGRS